MISKDQGGGGWGYHLVNTPFRKLETPRDLVHSLRAKKDTKNTEAPRYQTILLAHYTSRNPPEITLVQNNVRSCHHSRKQHDRSSARGSVARAAAPAGGMVVALGRVQVRTTPSAHPPSKTLGRRSAHWHVPVSRHARLLAA